MMDDLDEITTGTQLLGPTGRIWTVRSMTPNRRRVVLTCSETAGEHGAVMDATAVARMVRIDRSELDRIEETELTETRLPAFIRA